MGQPYIGEIRIFAGNFAPLNWSFCNGQTIAISQNSTLFQLIGTTYGGDGQQTFLLPDLQGRVPIHQGNGFVIGQQSGAENVTLNTQQIPSHNHGVKCTDANANLAGPSGAAWASEPNGVTAFYTVPQSLATMAPVLSQNSGGGQPHSNIQPSLVISFIIALFGVFPSQN